MGRSGKGIEIRIETAVWVVRSQYGPCLSSSSSPTLALIYPQCPGLPTSVISCMCALMSCSELGSFGVPGIFLFFEGF